MLLVPNKNRIELKTLIDQYKNNYEQIHGTGYKEDHLRQDILDRFFGLKIMEWDIGNIGGLTEQYKEVVNEDSIKIGKRSKAPDYSFRIGGIRKFFVEAKKPKVEIKKDAESAYQIRRYAWNADLPISILTNFEELSIYDCRIKPKVTDSAEVARIDYMRYEQYLEKFDQLYSVFSKEAILKGSFDKFAETSKNKKGTLTIGVDFLDQISQWRETFAKSIASNNPNLKIYEINSIVEKLIERILFLRICEDRSMERYESLKTVVSANSVYSNLVNYFESADAKYDSGIFDLQNDHVTYELRIEDSILKKIITGLYYPQCPYDFSVIGIDLLGNVYEKFLGEIITLTPAHKAKVEQKPEVKKAGGVYYTPKYIVDFIVKNTVGKVIEGKTPQQIESIKILDPACGSGSFLIGAYTYLLNYHLEWYMRNTPEQHKKEIFQYKDKQWLLTTEQKKKILLSNIYGVDLDPQAVEVTKLNLLLKVLENETAESINQQMKLFREKALPNLHENIKCGNSLVNSDIYKTIQLKLISNNDTRRINTFNWHDYETGFGALAELGFDVVIGNPPYIQIQKLCEFYPEEIKYIQNNYFTAKEKNIDIYLPFIEKGISLLSTNGVLGFICPNRFFNSEYSSNLRKYLEQYNIYKMVNFRHYFVFDDADTYTCLLFVKKSTQQPIINYSEIRNLYAKRHELVSHLLNGLEQNDNTVAGNIKPNFKKEETWCFMTEKERKVFEKLISHKKFSEFYEENFQGLICGVDSIYILKLVKDNGNTKILFSKGLNDNVELESKLVHRIIGDSNIEPYFVEENNDYILFPYDKGGKLIDPERLENNYPLAWKYLNKFKQTLRSRENGKFDKTSWYQFSRNQALDKQQFAKILIPHVVKRMRVAFDEKGEYFTKNVGVNSVMLKPDVKESPYYFLAILNSSVASFYICKTSIFLSNGFYASNKQFASSIPIRSIDFENKDEKEKHDSIVGLVLELIKSKNDVVNAKLGNEKELISRKINAIENNIDDLVCNLYYLDINDRKIMSVALPPKA
jgi:type I restriction-modification system DNA methylase subunit